ncbi:MAG: hypothetical protein ABIL75_03275 [candidate division WOR-3 bacterium]
MINIIFLIVNAIYITHPNGGEEWTVGEKRAIHWNWEGNISSVKIEYSVDGGQNWILIASSTPNDGSYLWAIPNTVSSNCFVKISNVNNPSEYDISDGSFSIIRPVIRVKKPNGGEALRAGDNYPIEWDWTGNFSNVKIEYTIDGTTWQIITNSTSNDGDFAWTVPNTPSNLCRVRITNLDDPSSSDISDNDFTIATNSLTVLYPNGGENFVMGKIYPVLWEWEGSIQSVKIEYSVDGGNTWNLIVASTQNDGSHYWVIPSSPSTNCLIKISDVSNPSIYDISNNNFTILSSSIEIKTPDGGEVFYPGDNAPIHWNWTGSIANVKIEYSVDGGNTWSLITSSTQNDGSYIWTVPGTPSQNVRIKITNVDDPNVFDISSQDFVIKRTEFVIKRPRADEALIAGERYAIHWDWRGSAAGVKLELWYKTQSGVEWWTITNNTPNDGSFDFVMPYYISDSAGIKITNVNDPNSYALSGVFRIVRPTIKVIYPNGGEPIFLGEDMEIIWETNGNIQNVMLQYSFDGTNWQTITTSTANDGSYHWRLPGACLIKVVNTSDIDNFDISDGFPVIIPDTLRVKRPKFQDIYYIKRKHAIYWTYIVDVPSAEIEYSIDGGITWKTIVNNTPNTGWYTWAVDTFLSNNAIVKVEAAGLGLSDSFTIQDTTSLIGIPLKILSPLSGDTFLIGNKCIITWHSQQFASPNQVEIYYSINNGSWTYIATVSNTQKSYEWTVPNYVTDNCKIMVKDVNGTAQDISDSFSIHLQKIRIVSPDSTKRWVVGKKYFILWNTYGSFANAVIDYSYDGGATWVNIVSPTQNDGEYEWTIPNTPSNNCLVRIRNYENPNVVDISDTFQIIPQEIFITSPVSGDSFIIGRKYFLTWDYTGAFPSVNIEYSVDGGVTWNTVALNVQNNQVYEWTIPNTPSNMALIKISNSANTNVFDISDTFNIVPQKIFVYSPEKDEEWIIGRKYFIAWWNTGVFQNAKIEYSIDGGSSWQVITSSTQNSGNYEWTIPNTPGDFCLVKVSNVQNLNVYGISDTFRIPLQTINVIYPFLNVQLISGRKYYITWEWTGTIQSVNLEYSVDGGNTWNVIQTNVNNNGYYEWNVPTAISNNCFIKITSSQNPQVFDISERFSILPQQIIITSPYASDTLLDGRKYTITWRTIGNFSNANLWYSLDGGQNWLIIASNVQNTGKYEWTVPEVVSNTAMIKIENSSNTLVYGLSDTLIISSPFIEITSPLLGDLWFSQRKYFITWNMKGFLSQINLYYSLDGGTTWNTIVLNQNNQGNYEWTIPQGISSNNARIKLSSSSNLNIYEVSDSFRISAVKVEESEIPSVFSFKILNNIIKISIPYECTGKIKIYDVMGRIIYEEKLKNLSDGFYEIEIEKLGKIQKGVYIFEFSAEKYGKTVFKEREKFLKLK